MTSPSLPTEPSPTVATAPVARPARHRRTLHRSVVALAVGGLLAAAAGVATISTPAATSATDALTDQSSTRSWYDSQPPSSGRTATVDSAAATTTQGEGVALIDTVLSDGEAAGTGIVLTSDGEVLTNYHVVQASTSIRVRIAGTGRTYTATVVGADPTADVALLQLADASGLTVSKIDDDTLQLGDDVTAVGNAGGTGELSAAAGEVTALSTSITTAAEDGVAGETLRGVIETDADVVPGDSGGPLVDEEGEVVGIDTAASSGTEIDGYAIPIDVALEIVTVIRGGTQTSVVRIGPAAFLGVELGATTTGGAGFATEETSGAALGGVVAGGAADDAGLAAGDTITELGSTGISDTTDLTGAIADLEPGDRVRVTWTTTDGEREAATVTLGASPVN